MQGGFLGLAALAFALGVIALQQQAELPPWGTAGLAGAALLPFLLWLPAGRLPLTRLARSLVVAGVFLALGFGWAAWRAEQRLAQSLPLAWEGRDLEVVGVIAALPQEFSRGERFAFDVEAVSPLDAPVPSRLLLSWYRSGPPDEAGASPRLLAGERWRFVVRLRKPHGNANPGGFDYEAWLLENGIRATGAVRPREENRRLVAVVPRPGYLVERLRQAVRDRFLTRLPVEEYPYAGVLAALAVGDQRAIQGDLWNVFNRTGTTHLISISGLHVTLVASLAAWMAGGVWRRVPALAVRFAAQRAALLAGVVAALAYTALAGFGVPAQRTLYMLGVAALAMASGRRIASGRVLAAALLTVLVVDPWAVLAAGFWLSFGAVAALLYVALPADREETLARRLRDGVRRWGLLQAAATLASMPVLLLVFGQFSLISPLANAVAIPVVSFFITPLVLLAALLPWDALLALAHLFFAGLMEFLRWCAQAPLWQSAAPPLWAVVAAALGVAVILLPAGVPGRLAGWALLLPLLALPAPRPPAGEAWITVLDVGQGLATVIRTANHTLVYDPGPLYSAESDAGQRVVVPYLRALGVNRLDALIVTHRDSDHAGGTASVRASLPLDSYLSSTGDPDSTPCLAGHSWTWDGVALKLLHPVQTDYAAGGKANHLSCTLRVEAGGRAMLLTSDIEARDEAALLARDRSALAAEVLLVPHHGSGTSSTPEFIAAVGARQAIVPVGYRNRFGHPRDEVIERYAASGATLWRTDRDGALDIRLAEAAATVRAWRRERPRYWHGR